VEKTKTYFTAIKYLPPPYLKTPNPIKMGVNRHFEA